MEKESFENDDDDMNPPKNGVANKKHFSTTDPDASVHRQGGRSKLKYKVHPSVDEKHEIITATTVTPGSVNKAHLLKPLVLDHKRVTGIKPEVCVTDSQYGTIENYLTCYDLDIKGHFESFEKAHRGSGRQKGISPKEEFVYDSERDVLICPEGEELRRKRFSKQRRQWEYTVPLSVCRNCSFFSKCTRSKSGRSLKRHEWQNELDIMLTQAESKVSKKDIRTRQHLMERSFARSCRYGFKRSRWRRLWRVKIQELLTASLQNILSYIRNFKERSMAQEAACRASEVQTAFSCKFKYGYDQMLDNIIFYLNWMKITV